MRTQSGRNKVLKGGLCNSCRSVTRLWNQPGPTEITGNSTALLSHSLPFFFFLLFSLSAFLPVGPNLCMNPSEGLVFEMDKDDQCFCDRTSLCFLEPGPSQDSERKGKCNSKREANACLEQWSSCCCVRELLVDTAPGESCERHSFLNCLEERRIEDMVSWESEEGSGSAGLEMRGA